MRKKTFKVTWEVEVEADDAIAAVNKAADIQKDKSITIHYYKVIDNEKSCRLPVTVCRQVVGKSQ